MSFERFRKEFEKKEVSEISRMPATEPLVSIAVQTFRQAGYIRECLDSLLGQKADFQFEILLGEDDSPDGTREICQEYAGRYPEVIRLFLHHRENNISLRGIPTGRFNFLYNLYSARGRYIAICEGDDYWTDPFKLQKQVDFLEKNPGYSAHAHNCIFRDETGTRAEVLFSTLPTRDIGLKDFIPKRTFHTATLMLRKESMEGFDAEGMMTRIMSADRLLYFYLYTRGRFHYDATPMAFYRRNQGGLSKSLNLFEFMTSDIEMYKYIAGKVPGPDQKLLFEARCYYKVERFKFALERKMKDKALRFYPSLWPIAGKSKHLPAPVFRQLSGKLVKLLTGTTGN